MIFRVKDIIFYICSFIFVIYTQLVSYGFFGLNTYSDKYIYIFIYSVILLFIGVIGKISFGSIDILLWSFLFLMVFFTRIYHSEYLESINIVLLYLSSLILMNIKNEYSLKFIVLLFFTSIPFSIYLVNEVYNTYAVNTIFIYTSICLVLLNRNKSSYALPILMIMFILLLLSKSRTALFTGMLMIILIYIFYNKRYDISNYLKNTFITLFLLITILLFKSNLYQFVDSYFISKWNNNIEVKSFFGIRGIIWEDVLLNKKTILGNNSLFFLENYNLRDSHNIFIQTLGIYGTISFIVIIIIFIRIIAGAIKYDDKVMLIFTILYLSIGFTENILFLETRQIIPITLFFIFYGNYLKKKNRNSLNDILYV